MFKQKIIVHEDFSSHLSIKLRTRENSRKMDSIKFSASGKVQRPSMGWSFSISVRAN